MALTSITSRFEIRASATTGNVNGAGFNTANANFPTDLTTDSNTANTASPVCSSATYNFVAGDVGAWLYVAAGTNFLVGWYQIASVASNKATLSAAIGAAVTLDSTTSMYGPSTIIGIASTGTPTGGTFGVDYSQQDTAQATATNYTSVGSSSTLTSVSAGFTRMMVGNFFHQTTTGTGAFGVVGWYEIVSFTDTQTVVLDRTPNSGTASVACTGFVGGAGRLNGLEDAFFEMVPAGATVYIKNGTYTISAGITISSTAPTVTNPLMVQGFNSLRGDTCTGSNRPVLALGANAVTMTPNIQYFNLSLSTTTAAGINITSTSLMYNCKVVNTSTTTTRIAITIGNNSVLLNCEAISQNGTAVGATNVTPRLVGCYIHDSVTGFGNTTGNIEIFTNVFEACTTAISNQATANMNIVYGNTLYGTEAKAGTGININTASSQDNYFINNIIYGFTTGVSILTTNQGSNIGFFNNYFNNTTDTSNLTKSPTSTAINPAFVGASQITGTTATTSGSVLTQSGGDFSTVTDNVDYLHVTSGTGVTTGIYLITSHTSTTLTVNNALGTSSGGDVNYFVTVGHNFQIGAALANIGFPSFSTTGGEFTSYPDVGAVQRLALATIGHTFS